TFCRPLRGLHSLFVIFSPVRRLTGATFCRPLRGLHSLFVILSPVRRLTGGYFLSPAARAPLFVRHLFPRFSASPGDNFLSPAARAPLFVRHLSPGSPTHRGITFCRPLRGLHSLFVIFPPVRRLTGGYFLSPAARAPLFVRHLSPGSPTHRGLLSV